MDKHRFHKGARSAACRCETNFTCGHCLSNAKPWHFTLSTGRELVQRALQEDDARRVAREAGEDAGNRRMRGEGRSEWNAADYAHAATVTVRTMKQLGVLVR